MLLKKGWYEEEEELYLNSLTFVDEDYPVLYKIKTPALTLNCSYVWSMVSMPWSASSMRTGAGGRPNRPPTSQSSYESCKPCVTISNIRAVDPDPHSFSLLDPDPLTHSICGSRRKKFEEKTEKVRKLVEIVLLLIFLVNLYQLHDFFSNIFCLFHLHKLP